MIGDAHAPGATPLDPDEAAGLVPRHVTTQRELNEWEQANILAARQALFVGVAIDPLDEYRVRDVHRLMFDRTWQWAGTYRHSDKNLGVPWPQIPERVQAVLGDARWWRTHATYAPFELAVRMHHRMVSIHPFANGNGRHARMFADLLLRQLGVPQCTWGHADLVASGAARANYLAALRTADAGDYAPLLAFARS